MRPDLLEMERKTESKGEPYHPLCILSNVEDKMLQGQRKKKKKSQPSVEWSVYELLQDAAWFTNLPDVAIPSLFCQ